MGAFSELDLERKTGGFDAAAEPFELGQSPATGGGAATAGGNAQSAWADPAAPAEPVSEQTVPPEPAEYDAPSCEDDDGSQEAPEQEAPAQSEEEKRKAHEEAEAKRKAEFDAKQAAKKQEEDRQIAKVTAMTDDEVMMASMKKVSEGTERLTRRNMKECVSEYVQTKCLEDPDFARRTMYPRKSMVHCFWYINRKAKEYLEHEMKDNDEKPENGVYGGDVPDELCYQWAEEYFRDPNAEEDHKDDEKFVPKTYYGGGKKSASKAKKEKKAPEKKPAAKPKNDELDGQQMSLLEAAG